MADQLERHNLSIFYGVKANVAATVGNNVDTYMNAAPDQRCRDYGATSSPCWSS